MDQEDYKSIIKDAVKDEEAFHRVTFSKKLHGDDAPWVKVVIRPVVIKGKRRLQFSYFDPKKDITKNFSTAESDERLDEVLDMPFSRINLQATSGDIDIRVTRKGNAIITRSKPSRTEQAPDLSHDHAKVRALPAQKSEPFLTLIGVTNEDGEVRPGMQAKFRQINEFLRVIEQMAPGISSKKRPVRIVDCGCGSAYLTFAAYKYLTETCDLQVKVDGVDVNQELIDKNSEIRDKLEWSGIEFHAKSIADFAPDAPPDVVLSLHACDTATDEAIAQGIRWRSKVILAAPCCQHELNDQISSSIFHPVLRHGILKERLADILTDAFRAMALKIMGYRTDVIEFVDPEHTAKNLLIRAERTSKLGNAAAVREYRELKEFWHVTPAIERMLELEFLLRTD